MTNKKIPYCFEHLDHEAVVKVFWTKEGRDQGMSDKFNYMCDECLINLIEYGWTGGGPFLCDAYRISVLKQGRGD